MRQSLVLVGLATLATGAATAAYGQIPALPRTAGSELVELRNGNGRAVVARQGTILVTVRRGRIRVVDLRGGGRPVISCNKRLRRVSATTVQTLGFDLRCFVSSGKDGSRGPWQVVIRGRGIFASARVLGSVTLDAVNEGPRGRYKIADQPWKRWPRNPQTYVLLRK